MSLLRELFPGLLKDFDIRGDIPSWDEEMTPWSIIENNEDGIQSQISILAELNENGVFIHPEAIIGDFVEIEGPSYVGPEAEIRHGAFLRKGSWICQGALVGHSSEIKNSVLLPGSKAPHFNYVGDSVLGFGVNLGAGVKISNVRNDRRGIITTLGDGTRTDTGLMKMGALIGDGSQLGCNVVTNPGCIIFPYSFIGPNETVSGCYGVKS